MSYVTPDVELIAIKNDVVVGASAGTQTLPTGGEIDTDGSTD